MPEMLRILVVTDIHGVVRKARELGAVKRDLTVVAGDLSRLGSVEEALTVLEELANQGPVAWVPGNCDDPSLAGMEPEGTMQLHTRAREFEGITLVGYGGSPFTPFSTPFEYDDSKLGTELEELLASIDWDNPVILVTHTPPYRSGLDRTRSGEYVGSRSLASLLSRYKPLLLATGHIHEAWGVTAFQGVLAVNPGPLSQGRYALVELDQEALCARVRLGRL